MDGPSDGNQFFFFPMPKMDTFLDENHTGSPTSTSLNVLNVLNMLNVLKVLHVHGIGLLGIFLDASSHLYISEGLSVHRSVRPPVRPSVGDAF